MAKDDFVECVDLPKVRIITQSSKKDKKIIRVFHYGKETNYCFYTEAFLVAQKKLVFLEIEISFVVFSKSKVCTCW